MNTGHGMKKQYKQSKAVAPIDYLVVKIMIPVDNRLKVIKTVKVNGNIDRIQQVAQEVVDEFKEFNKYLAEEVVGEVTFKLTL